MRRRVPIRHCHGMQSSLPDSRRRPLQRPLRGPTGTRLPQGLTRRSRVGWRDAEECLRYLSIHTFCISQGHQSGRRKGSDAAGGSSCSKRVCSAPETFGPGRERLARSARRLLRRKRGRGDGEEGVSRCVKPSRRGSRTGQDLAPRGASIVNFTSLRHMTPSNAGSRREGLYSFVSRSGRRTSQHVTSTHPIKRCRDETVRPL